MSTKEKNRPAAHGEAPPRWSRRSFGRFASAVAAAAAIWRPRVIRDKQEGSATEANHWEPITPKPKVK